MWSSPFSIMVDNPSDATKSICPPALAGDVAQPQVDISNDIVSLPACFGDGSLRCHPSSRLTMSRLGNLSPRSKILGHHEAVVVQ